MRLLSQMADPCHRFEDRWQNLNLILCIFLQITSASGLEADSRVSDFIDLSFWKRKEICCGTIFVGPSGKWKLTDIRCLWNIQSCGISGEAIVDPRLLRSCPRQHKPQPLPQLPYSIHTIETMIATELKVGILKCMF